MAIKQHYIPQSLLRRFCSKGTGKKPQLVVYQYGGKVFRTSTEGIAAEREFYSASKPTTTEGLDREITIYENKLNFLLKQLDCIEHGSIVDPSMAAEIICHLCVRNNHFRLNAESLMIGLLDQVLSGLSDVSVARRLLGVDSALPTAPICKMLRDIYYKSDFKLRIGNLPYLQFEQRAMQMIRGKFAEMHSKNTPTMIAALKGQYSRMKAVGRDAQTRALTESLVPEKRLEKLKELRWRIMPSDNSIILPDCISVSVGHDKSVSPYLFCEEVSKSCVIMPITPARFLMGSMNGTYSIQIDLNTILSACAWDFFVSDDDLPTLRVLIQQIRRSNKEFRDHLLEKAARQIFGNLV